MHAFAPPSFDAAARSGLAPAAGARAFAPGAGADLAALRTFADRHRRLFVLTGAGVSTASGIPAYRDGDGRWARSSPVMLQDFLRSAAARRRYWARSLAGWRHIAAAQPNAAHRALVRLANAERIERLVTQNVDGLHQRAGSEGVVELHGNLARVTCLDCGALHDRAALQVALERANPRHAVRVGHAAPDGDASVTSPETSSADDEGHGFVEPACERCGGVLKPDVVFFGEGVPRQRVDTAREALARADAVLVAGSSLMVWSGYRFCEWAAASGKPIAAINLGRTRADALLALKVERACGEALEALVTGDDAAEGR